MGINAYKNLSNIDKYMIKKQSSLHSFCILPHPVFMPYKLKVFQLQKIETDASLHKLEKKTLFS